MQLTAAALWLNTVFAGFDRSITLAVHWLFEVAGGFFSPFFHFISFLGKGGVILILFSLVLIYFPKTRRYGTAMLFGLAIGALITNCVIKIAVARPRPYTDGSFFRDLWLVMGQATESDFCFPSGHTTAAFAASVAVFLVGDKRVSWLALLFGVLMGISRIYLVVHYPSDVIGGVIVGSFSGMLGAWLPRFIPEDWDTLDFNELLQSILHPVHGKHEK